MNSPRTLIRDKVVPLRVCEVCGHDYTPRWVEQHTCGGRCARVYGGRKNRGRMPAAFAASAQQRRETRKREVEALCQRRWPELSVREIEIFNFAHLVGYKLGYNRGLCHQRRQKASAALMERTA